VSIGVIHGWKEDRFGETPKTNTRGECSPIRNARGIKRELPPRRAGSG